MKQRKLCLVVLLWGTAVVAHSQQNALQGLTNSGLMLVSAASQTPANNTAALSNADVIKMSQLKFSDAVILTKIKTSTCSFDTSMEAMVNLKESGVSDAVIQAMVEAGATKPVSDSAAALDPNDPKTPQPGGIYWQPKEGREKSRVQLEPTVYSGGKSGNVFGSAMTYGISKVKWKAVVRAPRANQRIAEEKPEFWFYFESTSHGLSNSVGFWSGASSPNEFVLARMNAKKSERELVVGEFGAFGSSTGTRSKDTVPFHIEKIAPGIYRVIPDNTLAPGEYCFFYAGGATALGASGGKLFDFGVDAGR